MKLNKVPEGPIHQAPKSRQEKLARMEIAQEKRQEKLARREAAQRSRQEATQDKIAGSEQLRRAVGSVLDGAWSEAVDIFLKRIEAKKATRYDLSSLGFLVSEGLSEEILSRCWEVLSGWKALDDFDNQMDKDSFAFFALLMEFGLNIDPKRARNYIEDFYIPFLKENEVINTLGGRTIYFWHIPKCGGTAFNLCLAPIFYRSGMTFLPSHSSREFHNTLLSDYSDEFPYLSSSHMPKHQVRGVQSSSIYQVASLRDPEARSISAWRQYYASLERRTVIHQHGVIWDYWPKAQLGEWAKRVPKDIVNRQTATFSAGCDPEEAVQNIKNIDLYFDVRNISDALRRISVEFGLSIDLEPLQTTKNVTDKSISFDEGELQSLRDAIGPDRDTFKSLEFSR